MGERAWKFLDDRGRGIISGVSWPTPAGGPSAWVDAGGPPVPCRRGVHACRVQDLSWWLSAQLWEVELDGDLVADDYSVVARRGRLIRRIEDWPGVGDELAIWVVWRCRDLVAAYLCDAEPGVAARLRACQDTAALTDTLAPLDADRSRPAGMAVALLAAAAGATNAVGACAIVARTAAHVASEADRSALTYDVARLAERRAQGRWLGERLALVEPAR